MKIKIKKLHPKAVIPKYALDGDAGMDIVAVDKSCEGIDLVTYRTGLAFEIPKGYFMLIFPRSNISKKDLILSNSVGVLDSGYRGELLLKFKTTGGKECGIGNEYQIGDRIGQIIIIPYPGIEFDEVNELSDTARGEGGFGSSGN